MKNTLLYNKAKQFIPGGVNSPVRSFSGTDLSPIFVNKAKGAYVFDEDGNKYLDYVNSWGSMILGHARDNLIEKVYKSLHEGFSFGFSTEKEVQLAEEITNIIPNVDMARLVNSGTEATMTAIRLARGVTGKNKIIKFIGCYHGHVDSLLVEAGSGVSEMNKPTSSGICTRTLDNTLLVEYNDIISLQNIFKKYSDDIAGVIVEPIAANMNCVLPKDGFLQSMRSLCDEYNSMLIFDEVITGFRIDYQGAQKYFDVRADIVTLGKIIGGGMPIGAICGSKYVMEHLAPMGDVYQAGTLSGNPIAVTAGLETLDYLKQQNVYSNIKNTTSTLVHGIRERSNGLPVLVQSAPGIMGILFTEQECVSNYSEVKKCDEERFRWFYSKMINEKILLAPSRFEIGFISICHGETEVVKTLDAFEKVFDMWRKNV